MLNLATNISLSTHQVNIIIKYSLSGTKNLKNLNIYSLSTYFKITMLSVYIYIAKKTISQYRFEVQGITRRV